MQPKAGTDIQRNCELEADLFALQRICDDIFAVGLE